MEIIALLMCWTCFQVHSDEPLSGILLEQVISLSLSRLSYNLALVFHHWQCELITTCMTVVCVRMIVHTYKLWLNLKGLSLYLISHVLVISTYLYNHYKNNMIVASERFYAECVFIAYQHFLYHMYVCTVMLDRTVAIRSRVNIDLQCFVP